MIRGAQGGFGCAAGPVRNPGLAIDVASLDGLFGYRARRHVRSTDAGNAASTHVASAAIPGVFPGVEWASRVLVDGGIVNNTPISHAVELGAERIYVLMAVGAGPLERVPRGVVASAVAALSHAIARRFWEDIARYADSVELTIMSAARVEGILPTDVSRADDLIADGLSVGRNALDRPGRVVQLRPAA